jgi:predicted rRNA methylase YqxC with S4 and FtsJ domains
MKLISVVDILVENKLFDSKEAAIKAIEDGRVKISNDTLDSQKKATSWKVLGGAKYSIGISSDPRKTVFKKYDISVR